MKHVRLPGPIVTAPKRTGLPFALALLAAFALCALAAAQPRRIQEAFARDAYDRQLWGIERIGARADPGAGQRKVLVPKGGGQRAQTAEPEGTRQRCVKLIGPEHFGLNGEYVMREGD